MNSQRTSRLCWPVNVLHRYTRMQGVTALPTRDTEDARQIFTHAMISLNLPTYEVRITQKDGKKYIYDFLRRRFIALTPEEWVRQNFTHFLVEHKGYPAALLANEVKLNVCGVTRRCDTVLYHREAGRPRLVIEYKAPEVAITQKVFNQISSYNSVFRADYLIVSNGLAHYCCQLDYSDLSVHFLPDIPDYSEL